jgi:hypothetical protein
VRPDTCTIALGKGQTLAPAPEGQPRQRAGVEIGWLQPGETTRVAWTVKGAGTVKVAVESTRGGVDRRDLELR